VKQLDMVNRTANNGVGGVINGVGARIVRLRRERMYNRFAKTESLLLETARSASGNVGPCDELPLISVTIATYNRSDLLTKRTLPSIFGQTYPNLEIIIVGDGCTDRTAEMITEIGDSRVRFVNLPERGKYPSDQRKRWMVAGVPPINEALRLARGTWIAHIDDDDIFEPEHIETMLRFAREGLYEFVYSKMSKQTGTDSWEIIGSAPDGCWHVPHSNAFFRSYLKLFKFDLNSWRYELTADHQVWERMSRCGVRVGFLDRTTTQSPLRPGATSHKWMAEDRV